MMGMGTPRCAQGMPSRFAAGVLKDQSRAKRFDNSAAFYAKDRVTFTTT